MRRFHWIGWDAVAALGGDTNRVKCATSETGATGGFSCFFDLFDALSVPLLRKEGKGRSKRWRATIAMFRRHSSSGWPGLYPSQPPLIKGRKI